MSAGDIDAVARHAARGDDQAFEALCRALQDDIWRYCYALTGDREFAFEAAQETFLRAVTAIRRYRGEAPIRVYMLVLARRAVAEVLRRERRHRDMRAHDVEPDRRQTCASGAVEIAQLVNQLPADLRQAFVLTQLIGLSYEQAAEVAGCKVGTIRSRVFRSRERLVAALGAQAEGASDGRS
ncbi:MAG: sigma-70 family RNA polymerase sigma factor [Egibacteraceae bacterium]